MRINHNISALNTYNKLGTNQLNASKNMEKLSSGLRINRAGDDAAGLAISEKMRAQIRGLDMATKNANDSISLIQTAEGALNETHSILQRMRELAVQATNDTNTDADRTELQAEINQLIAEVDRIGNTTEFNTKKLLDGTAKGVVEKRDGSGVVNNNSNLTITQSELQVFQENAKDAKVNGSYTLIKTNETMSGAATVLEFRVYNNDGDESVIKFAAGGAGSGTSEFKVSGGSFVFLSGSSVFASGTGSKAVSIDISGINNSATGGGLKVGESITFVFGAKQDAEADVDSAILTQIGANGGQTSFLSMNDMRSKALDIDQINVTDKWSASAAIERVNAALTKVSAQRSSLGAVQNRLEHTINNLTTASENLSSAESRIRDVDMAKEMMELTKNNILSQASQAMLAQANQVPQGVLQLLQ
ncbi:MAG: flagellin [Bacillales bacterium]|nr:flagellin [Bacillales bacterium]